MPTSGPSTSSPRRALGLLGSAVVAAAAMSACSGSSAPSPAPGTGSSTVTVTQSSSASSSGSATSTASSTSKPASGACGNSNVKLAVQPAPGGASAGHVVYNLVATNSGSTPCTLEGYPGISLTQLDSGKQLGAAADRAPGTAAKVTLAPGKTATAAIDVAQAGNFGAGCQMQKAAGFRIYLPGVTAAGFVPVAVDACTPDSVHQLSVKAFTG
ncbi:MAG: DUF4232 domain-containing protein [Actinomycetota bacterium]|nr:DUF4232 domain-containing protein [Actinomycetota bacterium]